MSRLDTKKVLVEDLNKIAQEAFLTDVKKAKPPSAKGVYISKVTLSSTMGKGFEIDTAKLNF